jgi:hypothetical protein
VRHWVSYHRPLVLEYSPTVRTLGGCIGGGEQYGVPCEVLGSVPCGVQCEVLVSVVE